MDAAILVILVILVVYRFLPFSNTETPKLLRKENGICTYFASTNKLARQTIGPVVHCVHPIFVPKRPI
jgi:hypothetical protein